VTDWTFQRGSGIYYSAFGQVQKVGRIWELRPIGAITRTGYRSRAAAMADAELETSVRRVRPQHPHEGL
jgi:hypothetical protein